MDYKRIIIPLVLIVVLVSACAAVYLSSHREITNIATISSIGIEVWANENLTQNMTSINWGTLYPGGTKNVAAWIRNPGTIAGILSCNTTTWNPPESVTYMTFSWSLNNTLILSTEVLESNFTLYVSPEVTGIVSFSFVIHLQIAA